MMPRRSASTSLKSCRRSARLNRDNEKRLRADVVQRRFSVSVIYIIHLSGRVFIVYPLTKTLLYSRIIETTI